MRRGEGLGQLMQSGERPMRQIDRPEADPFKIIHGRFAEGRFPPCLPKRLDDLRGIGGAFIFQGVSGHDHG